MANLEQFLQFEEDMDIIQKLGDNPGSDNNLSSDELKSEFDKGGNLLKTFINSTVEKLNAIIDFLNNSSGGSVFAGGSMLGPLNINAQKLYNLLTPEDENDAANKAYVDNALAEAKRYADRKTTSAKSTITLTAGGWSGDYQTVSAPGVTSDNDVFISVPESSYEAYTEAGIRCVDQSAGTLKFKRESVPSSNISIGILILN